ncbi:hypothetical protein ABZP36_021041 [Zizania latifolia]
MATLCPSNASSPNSVSGSKLRGLVYGVLAFNKIICSLNKGQSVHNSSDITSTHLKNPNSSEVIWKVLFVQNSLRLPSAFFRKVHPFTSYHFPIACVKLFLRFSAADTGHFL